MGWLWFLIIGVLAGWLASLLASGGGFVLLGDLVAGVLGAVGGGFMFNALSIRAYGFIGGFAMATLGAFVLLSLVRIVRRV